MESGARSGLNNTGLAAVITGTVATFAVTATLAAVARRRGQSVWQPINASSHWLEGPGAGKVTETDMPHTGVGFATNHAASIFWALPFHAMLDPEQSSYGEIAAKAALTAGLAATVDYGLMPKRLTPGWEHAVGTRGVAIGFVALAVGLFAGAVASRELFSERHPSPHQGPRAMLKRKAGPESRSVVGHAR